MICFNEGKTIFTIYHVILLDLNNKSVNKYLCQLILEGSICIKAVSNDGPPL